MDNILQEIDNFSVYNVYVDDKFNEQSLFLYNMDDNILLEKDEKIIDLLKLNDFFFMKLMMGMMMMNWMNNLLKGIMFLV